MQIYRYQIDPTESYASEATGSPEVKTRGTNERHDVSIRTWANKAEAVSSGPGVFRDRGKASKLKNSATRGSNKYGGGISIEVWESLRF